MKIREIFKEFVINKIGFDYTKLPIFLRTIFWIIAIITILMFFFNQSISFLDNLDSANKRVVDLKTSGQAANIYDAINNEKKPPSRLRAKILIERGGVKRMVI